MSVVARTTASLSLEARTALHLYVEIALEEQATPYFDDLARTGVLLTALLAAGGRWQDVLDLLALHEDHVGEFLAYYPARTRWASLGGTFDSPTAEEAATA